MLLRLPKSLHYPITVTELLKQPNDNVERFAPLFSYFYKSKVTEGDNLGNEYQVEKRFPTRFESNVEGVLKRWMVGKGAVITRPDLVVAEIEEPCTHSVQFRGMCANCGKDMTQLTYVTEQVDSSRAPINMVHDNISLTVSQDEATKVEDEAKRRLLSARKLSLVVDLDQTIIHATVDPTVAEWQKDEKNPNHDAVKDVRAFQLVDDVPNARGCWYYIKLRPGLEDFLENISKIYELHIYTMGTRAYAQNIATIIDPERKIFGDRILSRDESGSLVAKNLQRLFPVDTKMVVIIDDRGDVWNWNENFVKVTPYDFFVGIGDINSSFLPKKPGASSVPKDVALGAPNRNQDLVPGVADKDVASELNRNKHAQMENVSSKPPVSEVTALEQLVSMGGGDDPMILQAQTSRQDHLLASQLQDRPLLQKQKQLEAEDAASESASQKDDSESTTASDSGSSSENPRHRLLQDHDEELLYLEQSLRKVHSKYFETYTGELAAAAQGSRIAELRGSQKRKQPLSDNYDLAMVPDIKSIMPEMKLSVLKGVVIVFSGVIPLHLDWQTSDITLWARNFGARVEKDVGRRTTHVVAARNRTAKVRKAAKRGKGKIKVVSPAWLTDSIIQWRKLHELEYLLNIDESDTGSVKGGVGDDDDILSVSEDLASGVDSEDDVSRANESDHSKAGRIRPTLNLATMNETDTEDETDLEGVLPTDVDDQSPVGGTNEDWQDMNDELDAFLASDPEESDGDDSVTSIVSTVSIRGKKRSRDESDDESARDAPTRKGRKMQVSGKVTSLSHTSLAGVNGQGEDGSGLPTPDITAGEDGDGEGENDEDVDGEEGTSSLSTGAGELAGVGVNSAAEEGDGWSDFEDDLEAELGKFANENHGEG
ncbi:Carboxy-terminal domain (CTD) phosphatase [Pseudocyphellaria aurata]|nr:Carboxy-terminal domain (CTD) phosphatase [Pseudocyphellaria aurata]